MRKDDGRLLFGCLKDEWIPGLEESLQFKPLPFEVCGKNISKLTKDEKQIKSIAILKHFHKDTKYIIKELKPFKVMFINGSWAGQIHYQSFYWKACDVGAKIELISPFTSDREARRFAMKVCKEYEKTKLYSKTKKYGEKEIFQILNKKRKQSWDWIGQVASALVKGGKILALEHNKVLPYEAYQMHNGSIRERMQIPSQEMIETQLTNHSECEVLESARRRKLNLKGSKLYVNLFPCPVCAKILSRTEIDEIVYCKDYNLGNDIGYKILKMMGKKLKRVVI